MAQENNASQQIFNTIVTRDLDPKALDAMGKPTVNAAEADLISFNFKTANKDYGTVVILINGESEIEVYYGDNVGRGMERDDRNDWYDFLTIIRNIAKRNLYTFGLNNMSRLKYSMKSMAQLAEGWNGTNKTSYNKQGPAKLIIKHSRALGEGEARFRNIESLFVENAHGERFKMPFRSISGGKAMARHVTEGGNPYDSIGQHISNTVNEIATLGKFIRASKSNAFAQNTSALSIVEDAVRHYADLKRKAKKMISRRGYQDIFAAWDPMEITDLDETIDQVREVFSANTLDSRIEEALPILAKIREENMKEADIFEQWADRIAEGTWSMPETAEQKAELAKLMSQPLRCGPDGDYATEQLYNLVGDDSLFDDIHELSQKDPDADCRPLVMATLAEFGIELDLGTELEEASEFDQYKNSIVLYDPATFEIKKTYPNTHSKQAASDAAAAGLIATTGTRFMELKKRNNGMTTTESPLAPATSMRPKPRPANLGITDIGSVGTGTQGIDPKDNYSPDDFAKLVKSSGVAEGKMSDMHQDAQEMSRDEFIAAYGKLHGTHWDRINSEAEDNQDTEDMTEVTDIDTGQTALKAERDPMLETEKELTRLLQLARG